MTLARTNMVSSMNLSAIGPTSTSTSTSTAKRITRTRSTTMIMALRTSMAMTTTMTRIVRLPTATERIASRTAI